MSEHEISWPRIRNGKVVTLGRQKDDMAEVNGEGVSIWISIEEWRALPKVDDRDAP